MSEPAAGRDWILHAFADGELDPSEKMLVERELASDHEARVVIENWRRQKEALRQAFEPVLAEALPAGIANALAAREAAPRRWYLPAAAAAVLAMLAGAYVIYVNLAAGTAEARALVEQALSAHVVYAAEVRHPVEVGGADRQHLVTWLSKRLNRSIVLPDLTPQGFQLVGGRLLHEDRKPAAQFMYEDGKKRRLTVYLARSSSPGAVDFSYRTEGGYTTCYWLEGDTGYAVAGALPPAELLPLARLIYESLESQE